MDWKSIKGAELKVGDHVRVGSNFVEITEIKKRPNGIWFYWRSTEGTLHTGCPNGGNVMVRTDGQQQNDR